MQKLLLIKLKSEFHQLNAVSSGVKDIRAIIEIASQNKLMGKKTILFIDEIHRFNKAQQDALLHSVEEGIIVLIGATTENPSFEVIPALRSRARVFILEELSKQNLLDIINSAIKEDEFLSDLQIKEIDTDFLIYLSGGDARTLLNIFEAAVTQEYKSQPIKISKRSFGKCCSEKKYFVRQRRRRAL